MLKNKATLPQFILSDIEIYTTVVTRMSTSVIFLRKLVERIRFKIGIIGWMGVYKGIVWTNTLLHLVRLPILIT